MLSFDDLLHPVSAQDFFASHYRKAPLVLPANDARGGLFSYDDFNEMLAQANFWTPATLKVWIDKMAVPAARYCSNVQTLAGEVLHADPNKVASWLARGASVILNGAEGMTPAFRAVADCLEARLCGYAVANVYFSFGGHQAFDSHYDDHEVFAVQIAGEKTWRVYQGRVDNPIGQPQQGPNTQRIHDQAKGAVAFEHTMRPGEMMYIPRGQYHDALATTDASLHVTFSVQPMNGLAVIELLRKEAARESIFRDDLPGADGADDALSARLAALGQRLSEIAQTDQFARVIRQDQRARSRPRGAFSLPQRPVDSRYMVANRNLRMTPRGDGQVLSDGRQEMLVDAHMMPLFQWIFAASDFTLGEAASEFPALAHDEVRQMIGAMTAMGVLRQL